MRVVKWGRDGTAGIVSQKTLVMVTIQLFWEKYPQKARHSARC